MLIFGTEQYCEEILKRFPLMKELTFKTIVFYIQTKKGITLGHSVILHGCSIEDDSLIGMGATILNGAHIGKNSIIGANSLITEGKKIPERSLVMGSPGKVIREVTDEEIKAIHENAQRYIQNSKRYESEATEQKD